MTPRRRTTPTSFLHTRVARRILGLFLICALAPVSVLAVLSYRNVAGQLEEQGWERLGQNSRIIGLFLLERLQLLEAELGEAARVLAEFEERDLPPRFRDLLEARFNALGIRRGALGAGTVHRVFGPSFNVPALAPGDADHLRAGATVLMTLDAMAGTPILLVRAVAPPDLRAGLVWAEVRREYLLGAADGQVPVRNNSAVCILDGATAPLYCTEPAEGGMVEELRRRRAFAASGHFPWDVDGHTRFVGYWSAFLRFDYRAADWTVMVSESRASLLAPLAKFKTSFPLGIAFTLSLILLLSNVQIRRSMAPLGSLRDATRRIAARDFDVRVRVRSGDEFEDLANSFNTMADDLRGQFEEGERLNSALREAGDELGRSEARLRSILESAVDGIVTVDERGVLESINATGESMFGYTRGEVVGRPGHGFLTLDPDQRLTDLVRSGASVLTQGRRKDGSTFPLEVAASEARVGERVVVTAFLRDVSARVHAAEERARLEAQLRQAQKMETVGTLAGGIAHDFNNILTPIAGYVDLVMADLDEESEARHDLERVREATGRAKDLVRQILAFSRKGERQERSAVDLAPVVREALKLLRATLPATIEIRQHIDGASPVLADATQIHQVLMNLCTNAYHAMRACGGRLAVELRGVALGADAPTIDPNLRPGQYVCLSVEDTGQGMDATTLERLFEPFFTTKPVGEGTGLGLSVVYGIVVAHGGAITVESEVGRGSTFRVFLPASEAVAAPKDRPEAGTAVSGSERVLVVDDEEMVATVTRRVLERFGYEVRVCGNGAEALRIVTAEPDGFQLILSDQTMPEMTGIQMVEALRQADIRVPVILMTGYDESLTGVTSAELGVEAFLMKPVEIQELAGAVRRALDAAAVTVA
jgi:PAS domain S-box-containing protein